MALNSTYKYKDITEFNSINKTFLSEPIVKTFFESSSENKILLKKAIEKKDKNASEMLDEKFKEFFFQFRIISYISKLSRNLSIDFDKRQRKLKGKFQLLLDGPNGSNLINLTKEENDFLEEILANSEKTHLTDYVDDTKLINALNELTSKQRKVIKLIYIYELKQSDIARLLNETPQSITNTKRKALKKIRKLLARE